MPRFKFDDPNHLSSEELEDYAAPFLTKLAWFKLHGYDPHYYQVLFHAMHNEDEGTLTRFRHLVAGRRGGKTLSAAWDVTYYALHPREFHLDAHGVDDDRPLHIWILTKDYPIGMAALMAFRQCLKDAGAEVGKDFKENRGNRWFEFTNGTFVQFKTADDPESLRGAGLDILWMDEAALIPDERAWEISSPALADKLGLVLTSTTPSGKNWLYGEFWKPEALEAPVNGYVEYRSIDNPHFTTEEWVRYKATYHPLMFKQEFMASFDSMAGKELPGDWLKYWGPGTGLEPKADPDSPTGYDLDTYIGVDPAVSLADRADRFVISLIGLDKRRSQVYLLQQYADRIPFPDQVDLIWEWYQRYRPRIIGIEKNAYQAALVQAVVRHPNFPPVAAIWTKGKKSERILAMSPYFKIGKIRIRKEHVDFINEWIDYDSTLKNPHDDCLDSVELALRAANVLLPDLPRELGADFSNPAQNVIEMALRDLPSAHGQLDGVDEHLGAEW